MKRAGKKLVNGKDPVEKPFEKKGQHCHGRAVQTVRPWLEKK